MTESTRPRVLCTALTSETGPHFEILRAAGFDCRLVDRRLDLWNAEALVEALSGSVAVIAGSEPYPRRVIESLPELRAICRAGVGFDAVDLEACEDACVIVATTPGVNHHAVAEHALAMLLAVARGFPELDRHVRAGDWKRPFHPRVMGSTLGIVGLGRIGQAVATRAVGLGMKVLVCEPAPNEEFVRQWNLELTELDDLLARSDFVSLHLPMSAENHHLMNAARFARMKRGAVLINTARGPLVDERALVAALQAGHLGGAGLDVFEIEPLPLDSPLLECERVLLAPHVGGLDSEAHADCFAMCAETIVALREGGWPAPCIRNRRGTEGWRWFRAR
ncbi:MAG: phosphoglycerate dehydrogenase [Planctomycetaceae bacterium]